MNNFCYNKSYNAHTVLIGFTRSDRPTSQNPPLFHIQLYRKVFKLCQNFHIVFMTQERKPVINSWHDETYGETWHFDEKGNFVTENGKRRGKQKNKFECVDEFSDWLHAYVQDKLIQRGLIEHKVPNTPQGAPIFATPNALASPENLLVLICGSGRIQAGVWSVGVCSWKGLQSGSVLPYLDEAEKRNMEVIILNPNHPGSQEIKGQTYGMARHTEWVFHNMIIPANPRNIYIIAHSAGGACTCHVLRKYPDFCKEHVRAIALTDACTEQVGGEEISEWWRERSVNWVQSTKPLNSIVGPDHSGMCIRRSAAIEKHPDTQYMAYPHIWELFDEHT